jgi:hypothetical protein
MNAYQQKAYQIVLSSFESMKEMIESGSTETTEYVHAKSIFINSLKYIEGLNYKGSNLCGRCDQEGYDND